MLHSVEVERARHGTATHRSIKDMNTLVGAIDETVLELGISFVGIAARPDGKIDVHFRIVDRSKTLQRDARAVATDALRLLKTSPEQRVKQLASTIESVYVE